MVGSLLDPLADVAGGGVGSGYRSGCSASRAGVGWRGGCVRSARPGCRPRPRPFRGAGGGRLGIREPDQRGSGAGDQHVYVLAAPAEAQLDGCISLTGRLEVRMGAEPTIDAAEATALYRSRLTAEAANPRLGPAEGGQLVRERASQPVELADGSLHHISRGTFDRWLRAYREQGLAGLKPEPRADLGVARRHPELLKEACQLRLELPARSAAQISAILLARHGIRVAERTVRQHLQQRGLHRAALAQQPRVFGRFEAARPNELCVGDLLIRPYVPWPRTPTSRRAFLFLLVDDFSRLITHGVWMTEQNARAGQPVLRAAIQRRGTPEILYTDNGAPYAAEALQRTCAVLGIRLVHSRPYRPQGRGKVEKLNAFVRERFLLEAEAHGIASFTELNERFMAWAEGSEEHTS